MDLTATEFVANKDMMTNPFRWPRWPILPIKRNHTETPNLGFLVAWGGHMTTVFEGNLWELGSGTYKEVFGNLPQTVYNDYEAILDAGWRVD